MFLEFLNYLFRIFPTLLHTVGWSDIEPKIFEINQVYFYEYNSKKSEKSVNLTTRAEQARQSVLFQK